MNFRNLGYIVNAFGNYIATRRSLLDGQTIPPTAKPMASSVESVLVGAPPLQKAPVPEPTPAAVMSIPEQNNPPEIGDSISLMAKLQSLVQPRIEDGTITFEKITALLEARTRAAYSEYGSMYDESVAFVQNRIDAVKKALPPSQRAAYENNVDKAGMLEEIFLGRYTRPRSPFSRMEPSTGADWHLHTNEVEKLLKKNNAHNIYERIWTVQAVSEILNNPQVSDLTNALGRTSSAYSKNPYGVLAVVEDWLSQLAVKHARHNPSKLQQVVEQGLTDTAQTRKQRFPLDEHFFKMLNREKTYSDEERSVALLTALRNVPLSPRAVLTLHEQTLAQLLPAQWKKYTEQKVHEFVQTHFFNNAQPITLQDTLALEQVLDGPNKNTSGRETRTLVTMERLATILLRVYPIDVIVPMLETYQGHRALEGSMKPEDMVSDVLSYLQSLDQAIEQSKAASLPSKSEFQM